MVVEEHLGLLQTKADYPIQPISLELELLPKLIMKKRQKEPGDQINSFF